MLARCASNVVIPAAAVRVAAEELRVNLSSRRVVVPEDLSCPHSQLQGTVLCCEPCGMPAVSIMFFSQVFLQREIEVFISDVFLRLLQSPHVSFDQRVRRVGLLFCVSLPIVSFSLLADTVSFLFSSRSNLLRRCPSCTCSSRCARTRGASWSCS